MKIAIIGAGASGLVAGIVAAREGGRIKIFEQGEKVAKKLLSTGNGKCNYTNRFMDASAYHTKKDSFIMRALKKFDSDSAIAFFQTLGIEPFVRDGYVYPNSEQARAVKNALLYEIQRLGIFLETSCRIKRVEVLKDGKFLITANTGTEKFDKLIIACGSLAAPNTGSDGSAFPLIKAFGHHIIPPLPALCSLYCGKDKKFFKAVAGVRSKANIKLYIEGVLLKEEFGEVQFTDYGLSGIPIFQISRYAARALAEGRFVEVSPDLLYFTQDKKLFLQKRYENTKLRTVNTFGNGLINQKLWEGYINLYALDKNSFLKGGELSPFLDIFSKMLSEHRFQITATANYDKAQICTGGVDLEEIEGNTMESKLQKGLYFAGEVMDVDGICGGYNLQWAWTSAFIAAKSAVLE